VKASVPDPPARSPEQLLNHYEIEKRIASRLRRASREQRSAIYRTMYDELFRDVPDHPRLTRTATKELTEAWIRSGMELLHRFIGGSSVVVEFGPGDCAFAEALCARVGKVIGFDIVDLRDPAKSSPDNFRLVIYDGIEVDSDENDFADVVFSDQLIEHIHPEDIGLHFSSAWSMLKEGGCYLLRTPHAHSGPHDISKYFSEVPRGFHLREYTFRELAAILREAGYSSMRGYWVGKGMMVRLPIVLFSILETVLGLLPRAARRKLSIYALPAVVMAAWK